MKKIARVACLFLIVVQFASGQSKLETLDKYVEASRVEWKVPGLSIAIVQDGQVLLSKGYGTKELGKTAKVDGATLFGAMSTTKAMTAVAMGMLVDEGKVSWDEVIRHLPHFRVADPYVTSEIRVRDLFTHNTGVGNADFLWAWTPELSSADVVRRMQHATQAYSFRGGYTYQNIMYLVAGQIIERVSGTTWERFMTNRLFTPLGMTNTFPNYETSLGYQNRSLAHYDIDGKITVIPETTADPIAAAGAVWSTSDDIAKWVAFMLGNTTVNGKQLIRPATFQAILRPQAIIPFGQFYPTVALTKPHWTTYGFGWFQHDYRGEMVNMHTGSLAGRTAIIGLIPDKRLGVYIFGNLDHAEVRHALMYKVFDLFAFGDNSRDWCKQTKALYDKLKFDDDQRTSDAKVKRIANTRPSLPLMAYVGKYSDPFYGSMDVNLVAGRLRLIVNKDLSADLDHWQLDSFQSVWSKRWWGEGMVSFQLNAVSGAVSGITVDGAFLSRVAAS